MQDLKHEIARYFAQRALGFRLPVNNRRQLKVVCTEHRECPFLLWAFIVSGTESVKITRFVDEHSITHVEIGTERQRAPNRVRGVLLKLIAQSVLQVADVGVASTQIQKKAKIDHRIDANPHQAWRAKQKAISLSREEGVQSYMFMEDWLKKMSDCNPGSATRFERINGSFGRASLVHGIFNDAFQWMLPVVALDACHLKTKDKGVLYLASLLTGNFAILISGMAISNFGERENKDDWVWFLNCLLEGIPTLLHCKDLVVVSDRDKGLIPAVAETFPNAKHSYCSVHIKRNVARHFHTGLDGLIHIIAKTVLMGEVDLLLEDVKKARPAIAEYLDGIKKEHWISAYFPVPRYGIVTSNAAESMNSFVDKERLSAHLAIFVRITRKTNVRLAKLTEAYSAQPDQAIVSRVSKVLRKEMGGALRREVITYGDRHNTSISEVKRLSNDEYRVVDLVRRTCSCKRWEEMQYPCEHGYAAILSTKNNVVDFLNPVYLTSTCLNAVKRAIQPVDVGMCSSDYSTSPPVVKKERGARKTSRIPSTGEQCAEESIRSQPRCTVCGQQGHNRRTCIQRPALSNFPHGGDDATKWSLSKECGYRRTCST